MVGAMSAEGFFTRDDNAYRPGDNARGPWDPNSLHGRFVVGLLASVIEERHGADDFMPARLTVDMFRLPDRSAIEVATRTIRDGQRIKVIEADLFSQGVHMARASCQLLRKTANPAGTVWSTPPWDVPSPADVAGAVDRRMGLNGMWEARRIVGQIGTVGPRRAWMRELRDLVAGVTLTPFVRAALVADFASPFTNAGDAGLGFINSDVTLYLHRLPANEWIGLEVTNHFATDGVAVGECMLHDEKGPLGTATVAALVQRKPMSQPGMQY